MEPSTKKYLRAVVGAQTGSEGKGHVTHRLIRDYLSFCKEARQSTVVTNVRVAGPNAGHTVITDDGDKLALRTIPVGVATPGVNLVIAAGSEVDLPVLYAEIEMCEQAGLNVLDRLTIHEEATLLTAGHHEREAQLGMHAKIGSTGKGIGACRADRIMRTAHRIKDVADKLFLDGIEVAPEADVQRMYAMSNMVIVEGTQGYELGLHAGHYPQCTSSDTRAIDFLAMAGINPWEWEEFRIVAVARVYPIRVAGNSGPMKDETTWEALGLEPELTTVTKKVRRVGQFDIDAVERAVEANGRSATLIALTMVDQLDPNLAGATSIEQLSGSDALMEFLGRLEDRGLKVGLVTTGPNTGYVAR